MVNGWKVTAIIFITLFVLETSVFIIGYNEVTKDIDFENRCYYDVCDLGNIDSKYTAYNYEDTYNVCTCWQNEKIVLEKVMT